MYFDLFAMMTFRLNYPLFYQQSQDTQPPVIIANMDSVNDFFIQVGPVIYESKVYGKKESVPIKRLKRQLERLHGLMTQKYY